MRLRRLGELFPLPVYLGALALTTVVATSPVVLWSAEMGLRGAGLAAWALLLALCASQLAVAFVHWAATMLVRPRILPRLDFSAGIPPAHRTVVAVPTMLTDAAEVDDLLEALEVRFLAQPRSEPRPSRCSPTFATRPRRSWTATRRCFAGRGTGSRR